MPLPQNALEHIQFHRDHSLQPPCLVAPSGRGLYREGALLIALDIIANQTTKSVDDTRIKQKWFNRGRAPTFYPCTSRTFMRNYYHKDYYYIEKSPMHLQNAVIDKQQTSWQNSMALGYSQFDSIYISSWLELIWKESYVRITPNRVCLEEKSIKK